MTSKGKSNTGKWGEGTGDPDKAALNFCAPYGDVTATTVSYTHLDVYKRQIISNQHLPCLMMTKESKKVLH